MNHTLGIGSKNLYEFTACQRFYLGYLRSRYTISLSYASFFDDNTLVFELDNHLEKPGFKLYMGKYRWKSGEYVSHEFIQLHQEWHHFCFLLRSSQLNTSAMVSDMKMYVDGTLVQEGNILLFLVN